MRERVELAGKGAVLIRRQPGERVDQIGGGTDHYLRVTVHKRCQTLDSGAARNRGRRRLFPRFHPVGPDSRNPAIAQVP